MIDAVICDGGIETVRRQDSADPGDIVAALLENEATVKVLRREDGRVWLMPRPRLRADPRRRRADPRQGRRRPAPPLTDPALSRARPGGLDGLAPHQAVTSGALPCSTASRCPGT
ncbi:LexA family protein [Streptomyces kaempferi]|uniref:LexA family protein n=1 Tax=Streptomyces kaempferi TaxID=333725 RepID=A0ABW3XVK4_9ACTN